MTEYGTIPTHADHAAVDAPDYAKTAQPEAPRRMSPLDQLKLDARKTLEVMVAYKVDGRPGYVAEFSNIIESDDVKRYRDNAQGKKKRPEDANQIIAAAQPLIENNRAIYLNGEIVTGTDGENLTFRDHEWNEIFGGLGAVESLRKFMGDGQVLSMGGTLYEAAGYGQDVEAVDPHKL